jgi:hypothetical protein
MENIKITITGYEAYQLIQEYFPKDWRYRFNLRICDIQLYSKLSQVSLKEALDKIIKTIKDITVIYEFMGAYYFLELNKKYAAISTIKTRIHQLDTCIIELEYSDETVQKKEFLRDYYLRKQKELESEIVAIEKQIEKETNSSISIITELN